MIKVFFRRNFEFSNGFKDSKGVLRGITATPITESGKPLISISKLYQLSENDQGIKIGIITFSPKDVSIKLRNKLESMKWTINDFDIVSTGESRDKEPKQLPDRLLSSLDLRHAGYKYALCHQTLNSVRQEGKVYKLNEDGSFISDEGVALFTRIECFTPLSVFEAFFTKIPFKIKGEKEVLGDPETKITIKNWADDIYENYLSAGGFRYKRNPNRNIDPKTGMPILYNESGFPISDKELKELKKKKDTSLKGVSGRIEAHLEELRRASAREIGRETTGFEMHDMPAPTPARGENPFRGEDRAWRSIPRPTGIVINSDNASRIRGGRLSDD